MRVFKNIQEDDIIKEALKTSYGRTGGGGGSKHRTTISTAGVAFNRTTALKSRRTGWLSQLKLSILIVYLKHVEQEEIDRSVELTPKPLVPLERIDQ